VYFTIQETTSGQYVGFNGYLSESPVWRNLVYSSVFNLEYLSQRTEYSFHVKARNSESIETAYGPSVSVTTMAGAPAAPDLIAPAHNSVDLPISLLFSWSAADYAESYGIEIALDNGFADIVYRKTGITTTSIQVDNLYHGEILYWRVNATNSVGTGTWSESWLFTTITGPSAIPNLIYPDNGALEMPRVLSLEWDFAHDAEGYSIQVSTDSSFSTLIVDDTHNYNSVYYGLNDLAGLTTYFWRVKSLNSFGASSWSEAWKFTTIAGPPAIPTLIYPGNAARDIPLSVTLTWNDASAAEGYSVQVSAYSDFKSLIINDSINIISPSYELKDLSGSATYYWRVKSLNSYGASTWSETWIFSTIGGPPATPTLVYPANGALDVPLFVSLYWDEVLGAEGCSVQVSTDPGFSTLIVDDSINDNSLYYALNGLTVSTTYYWKLNAFNSYGASPWSEAWTFTTVKGTGIINFSSIDVGFYPNPVGNTLHFSGIDVFPAWISIISRTGVTIMESMMNDNLINTQTLSPGAYLLKVDTPKGIVIKRFIKL
jgi:hypothetical protein